MDAARVMPRAGPGLTPGQLLLRLVVAVLGGTACATAAPTQTPLMQHGGVTVSAEAMRLRMRALAPSIISGVETAADDIRRSSDDPLVQRRAIVWKLNTATALYRQLFSEYPAAGLMDCWAMIIQVEQYLSTAEALRELGPARDAALAEMEKMEKRVEATARWAAPERDLTKLRAELVRWTSAHPVERNLATRQSLVEDIADRTANPELSAFQSVGVASDNLAGIVARLDFLPAVLPKQSIWEAELAYQDYGEAQVRQMLKRADLALDRVDRVLLWLGGPGLDGFAERQRIAMMAAVDRERLALTELVETEQGQISEMIARERASVLEAVRTERLAATADVRQAAAESIGNANLAAKQVVDHLVLRLAMLFAGSILLWGAVANLVRRRSEARLAGELVPRGEKVDLGLRKP